MGYTTTDVKSSSCSIKNARIAFLVLGVFALTYGTSGTLLPAMVTTLEKRFDLTTSEVSWLLAANELGYVLTVMVVAVYGGRGHHVKCLVASAVGLGLSGIIMALPYFIFGNRYSPEQLLRGGGAQGNGLNDGGSLTLSAACKNGGRAVSQVGIFPEVDIQYQKRIALSLQFVGGIINGAAASPFWNIGISFLDDILGKKSGLYIGLLYAIRCVGPIFGFAAASAFNLINESLKFRAESYPGGQKDPFWIGAWWIGFVIAGLTVLSTAPCFALFDRKAMMKAAKKEQKTKVKGTDTEKMIEEDEVGLMMEDLSNGSVQAEKTRKYGEMKQFKAKDFLKIVKMYWGNPVFLLLVIGKLLEIIGHVGIFSFFPKFVEFHFRMTASEANTMTAIVLAGSAIASTAASGFISHRFPMSPKGNNFFNAIMNTVAAVLFPLLFIFVCPTVPIMGSDNKSPNFDCSPHNCSCPLTYKPVCVGGQNYFSACQAGCTAFNSTTFTYSNCLCRNLTAAPGVCGGVCNLAYYYGLTMFIIRFVAILPAVQKTQFVMSIGTKKTKPFGIASIGFMYGICGMILPPIAGKLISSLCLVRNPSTTGKSFCVLYDVDRMRVMLHVISFVPQIFGCIFFFLSWYKTPKTKF